MLRNKCAYKIQELTGKRRDILDVLKNEELTISEGLPSIQNGLNLALMSLDYIPAYSTKEVIVVYSSVQTIDPSNIFETIEDIKSKKIRVSIIGTGCEVC